MFSLTPPHHRSSILSYCNVFIMLHGLKKPADMGKLGFLPAQHAEVGDAMRKMATIPDMEELKTDGSEEVCLKDLQKAVADVEDRIVGRMEAMMKAMEERRLVELQAMEQRMLAQMSALAREKLPPVSAR
jgi:hypothetical protein